MYIVHVPIIIVVYFLLSCKRITKTLRFSETMSVLRYTDHPVYTRRTWFGETQSVVSGRVNLALLTQWTVARELRTSSMTKQCRVHITFLMYLCVCIIILVSVSIRVCVCLIYGRPAGRKSSSSETNRRDQDTHMAAERETYVTCPRLPSYAPAPRGGSASYFGSWLEKFRSERDKQKDEKIDRKIIITTRHNAYT